MSPLTRIAVLFALTPVAACVTRTAQEADTSATAASKPTMVYVTGSRIPVPAADSSARPQGGGPVQSVSQQEIQLSGQTNTGDALRVLVPANQSSPGAITGQH